MKENVDYVHKMMFRLNITSFLSAQGSVTSDRYTLKDIATGELVYIIVLFQSDNLKCLCNLAKYRIQST